MIWRSKAEEEECRLRERQLRAFAAQARQRRLETTEPVQILTSQPRLSDAMRALAERADRDADD